MKLSGAAPCQCHSSEGVNTMSPGRISVISSPGTAHAPGPRSLYVRSVNGPDSAWYRGVATRNEGHIRAGGVDRDVTVVEVHDQDDAIDATYRTMYRRYAENTLDRITSPTRHVSDRWPTVDQGQGRSRQSCP